MFRIHIYGHTSHFENNSTPLPNASEYITMHFDVMIWIYSFLHCDNHMGDIQLILHLYYHICYHKRYIKTCMRKNPIHKLNSYFINNIYAKLLGVTSLMLVGLNNDYLIHLLFL